MRTAGHYTVTPREDTQHKLWAGIQGWRARWGTGIVFYFCLAGHRIAADWTYRRVGRTGLAGRLADREAQAGRADGALGGWLAWRWTFVFSDPFLTFMLLLDGLCWTGM